MAHSHPVYDDDQRFVIDPTTRAVTNKAGSRTTVMQGDHNSEILLFEIPKHIEGHDMTLCNVVEVHYDNIGVGTSVSTRQINSSYKQLNDLAEDPENPDILTCSWTITDEVTQLYGTIEFSLKFICYDTEEYPGYVWNTDMCKTIDVKPSKNNSNAVYEKDPDLYHQLEERISDLEESGISDADLETAINDYFAENPIEATVEVDTTLAIEGAAADSKTVGDRFTSIEEQIAALGEGGNTSTTSGDAVLYTAQELTTNQKTQARTNIGATSFDDVNDAITLAIGKITTTLDGINGEVV